MKPADSLQRRANPGPDSVLDLADQTVESPPLTTDAATPLTPPIMESPQPPPPPPPPLPQSVASPRANEPAIAPLVDGSVLPELGAQPLFAPDRDSSSPGHRRPGVDSLQRRAMFPVRLLAATAVAIAFVLSATQVWRVIDEQPRLAVLAWGALISGALGMAAVVVWTYMVVENVRRVLAPATTQELPQVGRATMAWIVPMVFMASAAAGITIVSHQLESADGRAESSLPLALALVAMLIALPLMYFPISQITNVIRRIGGHGVKMAEWIWVPVVLGAVGTAMIVSLRAGGAFGEDFDGIAPTWVVAIAAVVPAAVVVVLGWRAAAAVETDVVRAFDRRLGTNSSLTRKRGKFSALHADDGPNHAALRDRGHLRQIPGVNAIGIVISAGLAGLALLSVVGSVVMYLFWQEGRDGILLATQNDRAWTVLSKLQDSERLVALGVVVVAALWAVLAVTNVRLASARRRNPLIAALAWPVAGAGIWIVGDRLVAEGSVAEVVAGFALQAALLYVPVAILERSADAIGSRRNTFRLAWGMGTVLLVHIQGLGGLSTISDSAAPGDYGRLAGYLAIGALVQLLAMFVVTDATRTLIDDAQTAADGHNTLVAQRAAAEAPPSVAPNVTNTSG